MSGTFSPRDVALIVAEAKRIDEARVADQSSNRPFTAQAITFDLGTAVVRSAALRIGFPFKTLFIESASDVYANVNVLLGSNDTIQSPKNMKYNDAVEYDYPINQAYIYWDAQSGKTLTLIAFVDARFRSGQQISVTGGSVTVGTGSSFTMERVTLTAATATQIFASESTRKIATIKNNSGASVWLGGSSVSNTGANLGYELPTGASLEWRNTGSLYGYSVLGCSGDTGIHLTREY